MLNGKEAIYAEGFQNGKDSMKEKAERILVKALEDIKAHSETPGFNTEKWSNYCHDVADKGLGQWGRES